MTTHVEVVCNGNYVAEVRVIGHNGAVQQTGSVGPGSMVRKTFHYYHGQGPALYEVKERPATAEEIAAAATAAVVGAFS